MKTRSKIRSTVLAIPTMLVVLSQTAVAQAQAGADLADALAGMAVQASPSIAAANNYRTKLMPKAHQTLDATFAAYQVGRADFASLFQAELQLIEFERTIRRAEAAAAVSRVDVEALIGKELS